MKEFETILYTEEGNSATITLNRPEHLNGIINTMMRELYTCLRDVALNDGIRVVQLTGAGKGFCPGADLKAFSSGVKQERLNKEHFHISTLLHEMPKVTVAAVNGACAGAGFGWACACDLRYAASSASFNSAFLGVAISGDMGGPWTLPRIVGAQKARELFFMPGKFSAKQALEMGLVARVFDDAVFRTEIQSIMERLAASAPLAIGDMKKNFVDAERMGLREYIELETERHQRVGASEDTQEAFKAFVEKRAPQFKGR